MITKNFILMNYKDVFIDNEYLDEYLNLINKRYIPNDYEYSETHHIIPKSYFQYLKLPIDNSEMNLKLLSYKDHIKAHWLLLQCSKELFQELNLKAIILMTSNTTKHYSDINDDFLNMIQSNIDNIKRKLSQKFWRIEEIEWLKRNFKNKGAVECARYLSNRSVATIRVMARKLNLITQRPKKWTVEEIDRLKDIFPYISDTELVKYFPERTYYAIQAKAKSLNLYKENYKAWSVQELDILQTHIDDSCKELQSKYFNYRSLFSIESKQRELRIEK